MEYISTRWYQNLTYSNPVDIWALGTIMAELISLRLSASGKREANQLYKITAVLGDPCENHGTDEGGVQMARDNFGFTFQKIPLKDIASLFDCSVPSRFIECIADLLKYDPAPRLTSFESLFMSTSLLGH
ncbi:hypothetical protein EI94DRAFT_1707754 [Lactarius quietus]|nr:hypothetical protein EI94DRAFT_1707754 [Lactarius quietus]